MRFWRDLNRPEKKVLLRWKLLQMEHHPFDHGVKADRACVELGNAFFPEKKDEVILMKIKGKKVKIKCLM